MGFNGNKYNHILSRTDWMIGCNDSGSTQTLPEDLSSPWIQMWYRYPKKYAAYPSYPIQKANSVQ